MSAGELKRWISSAGQPPWGWLPAISLSSGVGLLVVSLANTGGREGADWAAPAFWAGLLGLILPSAARLSSKEATRRERIGLILLAGLGLYLVKVLHSPYAFTFSDELIHYRSAVEILQSGRLFPENPMLPVSSYYPGLESAATALASLGGLSLFPAGLILIGAARIALTLGLFLFYELVSGSQRTAGVAVLLYMANPDFIFWSAQFSYESLAFPIAAVVLFAVARRDSASSPRGRSGPACLAILGILATVLTHHLTAFALSAYLVCLSAVHTAKNKHAGSRSDSPWGYALLALLASSVWLACADGPVFEYLYPIFRKALTSTLQILSGEQAGRQLFRSTAGTLSPLWEQGIGLGSVGLMLLALPNGLRLAWWDHHPAAVKVLAGAALAYVGLLWLRFIPDAWQIANRASEFLFTGLALVLALALCEGWLARHPGLAGVGLYTLYVGVIFAGGLISGWPQDLRLARPYLVEAGGQIYEPQGVTAARWSLDYLGADRSMLAGASNSLLLLAYGQQRVPGSGVYGVRELLSASQWGLAEWGFQKKFQPEYLAVDRRELAWDNMRGIYFTLSPGVPAQSEASPAPQNTTGLDRLLGAGRVLDTGDFSLYFVGAISRAAQDR